MERTFQFFQLGHHESKLKDSSSSTLSVRNVVPPTSFVQVASDICTKLQQASSVLHSTASTRLKRRIHPSLLSAAAAGGGRRRGGGDDDDDDDGGGVYRSSSLTTSAIAKEREEVMRTLRLTKQALADLESSTTIDIETSLFLLSSSSSNSFFSSYPDDDDDHRHHLDDRCGECIVTIDVKRSRTAMLQILEDWVKDLASTLQVEEWKVIRNGERIIENCFDPQRYNKNMVPKCYYYYGGLKDTLSSSSSSSSSDDLVVLVETFLRLVKQQQEAEIQSKLPYQRFSTDFLPSSWNNKTTTTKIGMKDCFIKDYQTHKKQQQRRRQVHHDEEEKKKKKKDRHHHFLPSSSPPSCTRRRKKIIQQHHHSVITSGSTTSSSSSSSPLVEESSSSSSSKLLEKVGLLEKDLEREQVFLLAQAAEAQDDSIDQARKTVEDVSHLMATFTEKVVEQGEMCEVIGSVATDVVQNVQTANEHLIKAVQRRTSSSLSSNFRYYVVIFFYIAGILLLICDLFTCKTWI